MSYKFMDVHSHILPGVDDGSPNMEISMEMLNLAYKEGIRHLFLTPHYIRGENQYRPEDLERLFRELRSRTLAELPDLRLHLGNEVYYAPGITEDIRKERIHTMDRTRYLLVEFNAASGYREIYQAVRELTQMRLVPVIAHVERYRSLMWRPELLRELKEMGACFQLNANGVLGNRLDSKVRWRRKLIENEVITFLGTDAHDLKRRTLVIQNAGMWMNGHISGEYRECLFWMNAGALIRNEYI